MPAAAETPCPLHTLPPAPTLADLEVGYMIRGGQVVNCDGARQLAVDKDRAEAELQARWREETTSKRGWWPF